MQSGGEKLTKEQLGDLTGDELLQALEQIIEDIDGLAPKAQSVAEKLATARGQLSTEFQILDTDVGGQLTKLGALYAKQGGALADLTKDLDLSTAEGAALLRERIQALFKTLEDPNNTVDLAGLSLEELIQALLDLKQGADAVATGVVSAAQKMQDAAAALKTDFEVYGTDQVGQVQQLAGLYGGVGGIGAALNGLDLSSAAGRTAAIAQLQQLYGGDKGNSEQTAAILELLRALRAVPGESRPPAAARPRPRIRRRRRRAPRRSRSSRPIG
jgi:hypothetical protein